MSSLQSFNTHSLLQNKLCAGITTSAQGAAEPHLRAGRVLAARGEASSKGARLGVQQQLTGSTGAAGRELPSGAFSEVLWKNCHSPRKTRSAGAGAQAPLPAKRTAHNALVEQTTKC